MANPQRRVQVLAARAYHACVLAHAAETLFVGLFGLLLALTAVAWQGSVLGSLSAWGAALLAGVCAGAAWWLEVRPARSGVARRIDRSLGLDGAFFTAFEQGELRGAGDRSLVAGLLAQRIGKDLSVAGALRCALPNSMPFLALPFLGATLLAMVRTVEPTPGLDADWAPRVAAMTAAMEGVDLAARESIKTGEINAEVLRELVDLKGRSRDLLRAAQTDASGLPDARAELQDIRAELERLASEQSPLSELAMALDQAGIRADSLLMQESDQAGARTSARPGSGATADDGGLDRSATDGQVPGETPVESGQDRDPRLANSGQEGRMRGRSGPGRGENTSGTGVGRSSTTPATPTGPRDGPEPQADQGYGSPDSAGVASGRWWSERDAAVVERWVRWRAAADLQNETREEDD